jgi:hypothetical protein
MFPRSCIASEEELNEFFQVEIVLSNSFPISFGSILDCNKKGLSCCIK